MTSHGFKQNEISQEQTMPMGTNFFKRSYFTVLRVLSFETIKILMIVPLASIDITQYNITISNKINSVAVHIIYQ